MTPVAGDGFEIKDSGVREEYASGMRRDTQEGKPDYSLVYDGPMLERYAEHLTKGAVKYGRRNWQLAGSNPESAEEELQRFISSAARHMAQWVKGERDEDHMAAVVFNLNAAEFVRERMARRKPQKSSIPVSAAGAYAAAEYDRKYEYPPPTVQEVHEENKRSQYLTTPAEGPDR